MIWALRRCAAAAVVALLVTAAAAAPIDTMDTQDVHADRPHNQAEIAASVGSLTSGCAPYTCMHATSQHVAVPDMYHYMRPPNHGARPQSLQLERLSLQPCRAACEWPELWPSGALNQSSCLSTVVMPAKISAAASPLLCAP